MRRALLKALSPLFLTALVVLSAAPLFATASKPAKTAPARPADATAQCKDGTYSTSKTQQGACNKHGGVGTWFGGVKLTTAGTTTSAPAVTTTSAPSSGKQPKKALVMPAPAPAPAPVPVPVPAPVTPKKTVVTATPAPAPAPAPVPVPAPVVAKKPAVTTTSAPATTAVSTSTAGVPQNATARCKDGTFSFAKQHSGACSRHGGVAEWYK